jgi:peptidyl-prolyl cis-trans isomerase D
MAIVNKIRERSGIAVAVIAVALLLFILGSDFLTNKGGGSLFGSDANKVGEINGTTIDQKQFLALVEAQKLNFEQNQGRSASESDLNQIRDQVWDKLIVENSYMTEFAKLGITVTDEELKEMVQGAKNMHPYVKQQFSDQAGNFNTASHAQFIQAYTSGKMPVAQKTMWDNFKRELKTIRMREKYSNLLAKMTYTTKVESKSEYNVNTEKASGKFLFVPYYSILDSTIKVEESEIKDYYGKHKDEYIPLDNRSLSFISFQLTPTKEDSAALNTELKSLARGLATAADPGAFANSNSDLRIPVSRSANQISPDLRAALGTAIVGSIIGPFKESNTYTIHKYLGTETDSLFTVRASHILIRSDSTMSDSARAAARVSAATVLAQVKSGVDFAQLAAQFGSDGTAQKGGDLGVFQNNGQMIKPFENAIFGFSGTGVLPNLVTTDFGYHIVKVTEAKSNTKYKLATIAKELQVGESASNAIFSKAENLRASCSTIKDLEAAAKKDNSLTIQNIENLQPSSSSLNMIQNAKEVTNWAYSKNAEEGKVADRVFVLGDTYVIAALKSAADKSDPKAMDFKDAITARVRNDKKAATIISKLGDGKGDMLAMSKKYGAGALVEEVKDINFFSGSLNTAGREPIGLGKLFGQKVGQRSKPLQGETGVIIMETVAKTAAPAIADYSLYKQQIKQRAGQQVGMVGEQVLRENAKIQDNRARMF